MLKISTTKQKKIEKNKTVYSKESAFKVCLIKPPANTQKGTSQSRIQTNLQPKIPQPIIIIQTLYHLMQSFRADPAGLRSHPPAVC